ncbi:MAG TPA: hypothetical protein VHN14_15200 [Kofleriaceae bacterium]|nr:hypothetical protein [Kofleriaceae bacterium]
MKIHRDGMIFQVVISRAELTSGDSKTIVHDAGRFGDRKVFSLALSQDAWLDHAGRIGASCCAAG